jgi:hypothetical protein
MTDTFKAMNTYEICIERRDGSREMYRIEAESTREATPQALAQHTARTGDPIDGEACWVRQLLQVPQPVTGTGSG